MKKITDILADAMLTALLAIKCTLGSVQNTISEETTSPEIKRPLQVMTSETQKRKIND